MCYTFWSLGKNKNHSSAQLKLVSRRDRENWGITVSTALFYKLRHLHYQDTVSERPRLTASVSQMSSWLAAPSLCCLLPSTGTCMCWFGVLLDSSNIFCLRLTALLSCSRFCASQLNGLIKISTQVQSPVSGRAPIPAFQTSRHCMPPHRLLMSVLFPSFDLDDNPWYSCWCYRIPCFPRKGISYVFALQNQWGHWRC